MTILKIKPHVFISSISIGKAQVSYDIKHLVWVKGYYPTYRQLNLVKPDLKSLLNKNLNI